MVLCPENVLKFYNFPVLKKIKLLCSGLGSVDTLFRLGGKHL